MVSHPATMKTARPDGNWHLIPRYAYGILHISELYPERQSVVMRIRRILVWTNVKTKHDTDVIYDCAVNKYFLTPRT